MKITAISDLHGHYPELPGGDLLIVAGDLTARDKVSEHIDFARWLSHQNYRKIVVVAGNHDGQYEEAHMAAAFLSCEPSAVYLEDSGTTFEGYKIWGMPWTPTFCDWHFMAGPEKRKEKCDLIPHDIDILVTHGPPYGILDQESGGEHCGCRFLRSTIERIQPRLHIFGHIHEGYGHEVMLHTGDATNGDDRYTHIYNVAIMNEDYEPVNKPTEIEL